MEIEAALLSNIVTEIVKKLGSVASEEIQSVCGLKTDSHKIEDTISTVKAVLFDAQQQHATNHEASDWLEKLRDVVDDVDDLLDDFSTQDLWRKEIMTSNKKAKKVRIFFSSSNQLFFRVKMSLKVEAFRVKMIRKVKAFRVETSRKVKDIRERLDAIVETNIKFHFSLQWPMDMQVDNILSYDQLPSHLKQCFAICSLYPKDCVIDKQQLIQLWSAHGFIPSSSSDENENQDPEDVGDLYFMTLLRNYFFQDDTILDEFGNIISCKMHHCMHDLAVSVAGSESFIVNLGAEDVSSKIRHMSFGWWLFMGRSYKIPATLLGAIKTRTFFLPAQPFAICFSCEPENPLYATILSNFKRLRVLDLHCFGMNLPSCISKLRHLRYLDLSCNGGIQTLPNSITELRNLQTLKLFGCSLKELPRDIRKLVSLRHLELSFHNCLTDMPRGLGQLTSLRTLTRFIVGRCNRLRELKDLNNLRGELLIELPKRLPFSERPRLKEAEEANLEGKEFLQSLKLNFGNNSYDDDDDGELGLVLEALQPHENMKKLKIEDYKVVRLPTWISSLSNLVEISLSQCMGCKYLPKIEHLSCLKSLRLHDLFSLEYIDDDNSCGVNNDSLSSSRGPTTTTFFPSLKYIKFQNLPNLKGWSRNKEALLPSFPCLLESVIWLCPRLTSMPLQPTVVKLEFRCVSEKVVQQQLLTTFVATTSSSSLVPLSNLKELEICGIDHLVTLPEGLLTSLQKLKIVSCERLTSLSRGMRHLTSLQKLEIVSCERLTSLSRGMRHLTSLQKLEIVSCERLTSLSRGMRHLTALMSLGISHCKEIDLLDGDDDGMHFQGLRNLTSLFIYQNPKLESLPAGLQHVTTLQDLSIRACENWKGLPEWIGNLTSLQHLRIRPYRKSTSLPEGMRSLTALQKLEIEDCSQELKDRCQKETGEDWPKIAHIPNVRIEVWN